jgi:hypothetical protein
MNISGNTVLITGGASGIDYAINDIFEIGFGMTEGHIKASGEDIEKSFQQMNNRW